MLQVYGEVGWQDLDRLVQKDTAYVAGVYLPYLSRYLDLRVELAELGDTTWFRHDIFRSGFTHKGRILSHPAGGGGRELYGRLGMAALGAKLGLWGAFQERADPDGHPAERHNMVGADWSYSATNDYGEGWSAAVSFGYDRVQDSGFQGGAQDDLLLGQASIRGRW